MLPLKVKLAIRLKVKLIFEKQQDSKLYIHVLALIFLNLWYKRLVTIA